VERARVEAIRAKIHEIDLSAARSRLEKQPKQEMLEAVQAGIRKKDQNMSDEGAAAPAPAHAAHVASRV
jgi:hypothetical protein